MEVILLERIAGLGHLGDTVRVKDGYARNYLLPKGKALRANAANRARFEAERAQIEARNEERRSEAASLSERMEGLKLVAIRAAGETGQLYGSVTTRDIADLLAEAGFNIARSQVNLTQPIKTIGIATVEIQLHPEVTVPVSVNVARSADEAERQERGETLTSAAAIYGDDVDEAARPADFFDPDAEIEEEAAETPAEDETEN